MDNKNLSGTPDIDIGIIGIGADPIPFHHEHHEQSKLPLLIVGDVHIGTPSINVNELIEKLIEEHGDNLIVIRDGDVHTDLRDKIKSINLDELNEKSNEIFKRPVTVDSIVDLNPPPALTEYFPTDSSVNPYQRHHKNNRRKKW